MPRGNRSDATSKHPTPEPEPETQPEQAVTSENVQGFEEKLADLQRIEAKLAALEKERERRITAGLAPAFVYRIDEIDEDQLSPSMGSDGSCSLAVSPTKHDGVPGSEQAALLGSSDATLEQAPRRRSPEDNSTLRSTSEIELPFHTEITTSESKQLPAGTSSCSSWCEQLLGRFCGASWSNNSSRCNNNSSSSTASGVGAGGGGLGGGVREDADRVYDTSSFCSADAVANARTGAAAGDLFADFEAKAKLFEQLAADASVEVSFVEQDEQQEEKSRLI